MQFYLENHSVSERRDHRRRSTGGREIGHPVPCARRSLTGRSTCGATRRSLPATGSPNSRQARRPTAHCELSARIPADMRSEQPRHASGPACSATAGGARCRDALFSSRKTVFATRHGLSARILDRGSMRTAATCEPVGSQPATGEATPSVPARSSAARDARCEPPVGKLHVEPDLLKHAQVLLKRRRSEKKRYKTRGFFNA